jgi:catechol 2,3-dioxygenase-like lactoylglutathione lyase family enzyme
VIVAAHVILFTRAADETRAFLRDALGFSSVDAGGGWLIFALPPAEVAVHPSDEERHELYLMCDDLEPTMARLEQAGATFDAVQEERWGRIAVMTMPGGARLPIYQPLHASPVLSALEGS